MKKKIVHFDKHILYIGYYTPCGLGPEYAGIETTTRWKRVTCKSCLKKKQGKSK